MIDLILSEDSRQFQELTRKFAQKEIAPQAHQFDHDGAFPEAVFQEAGTMGLMSVLLPEEFGGPGLSLSDACVIVEEFAMACAGTAMTPVGNLIALAPLLVADDKSKLAKCAERLSSNGFAGAALSQAKCSINTGGKFNLSAERLTVLNGNRADKIVVSGFDSSSSQRRLFLLDRDEVEMVEELPRFGLRCADIAVMQINALVVANDRLIGEDGNALAEKTLMISLPLIAACASGIIRASLEHSLRYSKERHAFGQPIHSFQSVAFMMSDMARNYQAARLMTWRAARLYDAGAPERMSTLAACGFAVDSAMAAATDAVQIFGGYGYSKEYPVEKLMRDAKLLQMLQPTSFETKVSLGRELLAMH